MSEAENETVIGGRNEVSAILKQTDARLLVVAGPCSIHDTKGALEYAHRLAGLRRTRTTRRARWLRGVRRMDSATRMDTIRGIECCRWR